MSAARAPDLVDVHGRLGGAGLVPAVLVGPDEEQALGEERGEPGGACPGGADGARLGALGRGLRDPGACAGAVEGPAVVGALQAPRLVDPPLLRARVRAEHMGVSSTN